MPSTNQSGEDTNYRNEAHRVFKTDLNPVPMIRGIEDTERAKLYWNESWRNDASDRVKELIEIRMKALNR